MKRSKHVWILHTYCHRVMYGKPHLIAVLTIPLICFFLAHLVFPSPAGAQRLGAVITYQDSISFDEEDGQLQYPSAVAIDSVTNEIFVIDGKSRIIIYSSDAFPLYTLDKNSGIYSPQGIAFSDNRTLYVAQSASEDNPRHRVSVYNECLKREKEIYITGFEGAEEFFPHRIASGRNGNIYLSATHYPGVLVLDEMSGIKGMISPEEEGKRVDINSVTVDMYDNIYLVSAGAGRIYVYDKDIAFLYKFGEKGGSTGKLSRPRGVGIDSRNGWLYVIDYMRHTTTVYNNKGVFLFEFGGLGWGEGWFQHPVDIAISRDGRIMVADFFNNRVQIFKSWYETGFDKIKGKKVLVTKQFLINKQPP